MVPAGESVVSELVVSELSWSGVCCVRPRPSWLPCSSVRAFDGPCVKRRCALRCALDTLYALYALYALHTNALTHILLGCVLQLCCASLRGKEVHQPVFSTRLAIHAHYYFWDTLV